MTSPASSNSSTSSHTTHQPRQPSTSSSSTPGPFTFYVPIQDTYRTRTFSTQPQVKEIKARGHTFTVYLFGSAGKKCTIQVKTGLEGFEGWRSQTHKRARRSPGKVPAIKLCIEELEADIAKQETEGLHKPDQDSVDEQVKNEFLSGISDETEEEVDRTVDASLARCEENTSLTTENKTELTGEAEKTTETSSHKKAKETNETQKENDRIIAEVQQECEKKMKALSNLNTSTEEKESAEEEQELSDGDKEVQALVNEFEESALLFTNSPPDQSGPTQTK